VRPLEALIEVLVVEVSRDRSLELGVDVTLPAAHLPGHPNTTFDGFSTGIAATDAGLHVVGIGGDPDLEATIRAAASKGDVTIVSRPSVIAANNQEAQILVGSQQPFVALSRTLPTDGASTDQVVQYQDVGTKLSVRPTISGDGYVTLTHSAPVASPASDTTTTYDGHATLLNLGPAPRRIRFQVDETNGTLGCVDLLGIDTIPPSPCANAGGAAVPISNNVVLMKVQYGLADPNTGYLQKWVKGSNDGTEDWTDSTVLAKDFVELSRIKAIRIALIVRSESYDKCAYADVCPDPTTNRFSYTLFDQCDGIPCPAAISGTLDPTPGKGNFRYRVYETVVPLRNAVWNLHKKT